MTLIILNVFSDTATKNEYRKEIKKKETYRMDILEISKNVGFKNDLVQMYYFLSKRLI